MINLGRVALLAGVFLCPGLVTSQVPDQTRFLQHVKSAVGHLEKGELSSAESELRAALAIDSRAPNALTLLGFVHERSGRLEEAVHYHQEALSIDPEYKPARNNLGSSYYRLGKPDLALREFERVRELDPTDLTANFNAGRVHLERRAYPQAVERLEAARAAAPYDVGVLLGLAEGYFSLDRTSDADEVTLPPKTGPW